ncbi:hypothetical protein [Azospirillum sp. TSH64]|uniref:hypothetical protein n=1 Tax=Azospirillum sp. TSH64 TaxID=652740 RepID=UPI000D60413D|nr:hypothetical protein [Azospirillum sp. TSH64]PWC81236.1 hypothetical protein TSH64_00900 [Azospirillum sp. TSH64]
MPTVVICPSEGASPTVRRIHGAYFDSGAEVRLVQPVGPDAFEVRVAYRVERDQLAELGDAYVAAAGEAPGGAEEPCPDGCTLISVTPIEDDDIEVVFAYRLSSRALGDIGRAFLAAARGVAKALVVSLGIASACVAADADDRFDPLDLFSDPPTAAGEAGDLGA